MLLGCSPRSAQQRPNYDRDQCSGITQYAVSQGSMSVMRSHFLAWLLATLLIVGAASHRLGLGNELETGVSPHRSLLDKREVSNEAAERQRILAELEEVHQLRERMLQEGGTPFCSSHHDTGTSSPGLTQACPALLFSLEALCSVLEPAAVGKCKSAL